MQTLGQYFLGNEGILQPMSQLYIILFAACPSLIIDGVTVTFSLTGHLQLLVPQGLLARGRLWKMNRERAVTSWGQGLLAGLPPLPSLSPVLGRKRP